MKPSWTCLSFTISSNRQLWLLSSPSCLHLGQPCCCQAALCQGRSQDQVTFDDTLKSLRAQWSSSRGTGTGRLLWTWRRSTATRTSSSSWRARRGGGTPSCQSSLTSGTCPAKPSFYYIFQDSGLWAKRQNSWTSSIFPWQCSSVGLSHVLPQGRSI